MQVEETLFFPTPIWSAQVPDAGGMRAALRDWVLRLRAADPAGVQKSNLGGWQSQADLHRYPEFEPLAFVLGRVGTLITAEFEVSGHALVIQNAWANINGFGHGNAPHVHAGSALSGAFYVQVPPDAGDFEALDPRGLAITARPTYPQAAPNRLTENRVTIPPAEGLLLCFPGWMQHYVHPNRSQTERIGFSFNMAFVRA